jgi:hypothetical protein
VRHLIGIILAVVMAATLFFGACWGVVRIIAVRGTGASFHAEHALTSVHGLEAVGAVAGTGLLLGILLIAPRVSPLATGLPGVVLIALSALWIMHSQYTLRYVPFSGTAQAAGLTYLLDNGVLAMLGIVMIVPLFAPSRWRKLDDYVEDEDEDFSVPAALGMVP